LLGLLLALLRLLFRLSFRGRRRRENSVVAEDHHDRKGNGQQKALIHGGFLRDRLPGRPYGSERGVRERIEPARVKGMALEQTPRDQPQAGQYPVVPQGLQRVLGTGRIEAARRGQKRPDEILIAADKKN
jgi:hypothetical protein